MKIATVSLKSLSPYGQSRFHNSPKLEKELADDYEKRTWRERLHALPDGEVYIPPTAFKNCLAEAAKYLSMGVAGKGKATYTKHFLSGIMVTDELRLGVKKEDVDGQWLHLNADGVRGSGKRVLRCMPRINAWEGKLRFIVVDDIITEDVFRKHIETAGQLVGVGYFRPRQGGFWGRFEVTDLVWED